MKVISCTEKSAFSVSLLQNLKKNGFEFVKTSISRFKDGEVSVDINENLRGEDVFVIASTSGLASPNESLVELLITIDALKRASAKNIIAVLPYFFYSRQDRKSAPRSPISARLVANLIETAGATSVITMDLHASQIQGFFNIPVDNIYSWPAVISHIKASTGGMDIVITSPDVGGVVRARSLAKRLNTEMVIVDKRREKAGVSEVMNIIGNVDGKVCVISDDILDSGGTLCNCADELIKKGARQVIAYITHAVFSANAVEKITNSKISKVYITDTIDQSGKIATCSKIEVLSAAPLFFDVIQKIVSGDSVSSVFV